MSESKHTKGDGGPAFPNDGAWGNLHPEYGMTLRDYFAAQALANMRVHENSDNPLYWKRIAAAAFTAADAMLAQRSLATGKDQ